MKCEDDYLKKGMRNRSTQMFEMRQLLRAQGDCCVQKRTAYHPICERLGCEKVFTGGDWTDWVRKRKTPAEKSRSANSWKPSVRLGRITTESPRTRAWAISVVNAGQWKRFHLRSWSNSIGWMGEILMTHRGSAAKSAREKWFQNISEVPPASSTTIDISELKVSTKIKRPRALARGFLTV